MVELELLALFYMRDIGTHVIRRSLEVLGENNVFMEHEGEPRLDDHLRRLHKMNCRYLGIFE